MVGSMPTMTNDHSILRGYGASTKNHNNVAARRVMTKERGGDAEHNINMVDNKKRQQEKTADSEEHLGMEMDLFFWKLEE